MEVVGFDELQNLRRPISLQADDQAFVELRVGAGAPVLHGGAAGGRARWSSSASG